MWSNIQRFCETCDVCQKTKPDRRGKAGILHPLQIPLLPFDIVTLDLITGLPSLSGHDAVMVVVDKLMKFVSYIPTQSTMDQKEFAKLFVTNVARCYGIPLGMVADRDPHWAKSFWESVASELNLDLMLSTSHHPQMDGQSERAIQQLAISLRAFVASNQKSWAHWLPELAFAYNSTPLQSVGQSPFFLLHGYHPRSPVTALDPVPRGIGRLAHNVDANQFIREMTAARDSARDALALAQSKQAEQFNKGRQVEEFEEGDEVLVNPHSLELVDIKGVGQKLLQRRIGPFRISEKINDTVY